MPKIAVVGTGYVGLVTGACLASAGSHVVCVDNVQAKIQALQDGRVPIYEPGLAEVIRRAVADGKLEFTTNLVASIVDAEIAFIAVGTPSDIDGSADLSAVLTVAEQIAACARGRLIVVDKSTVPVGTAQRVRDVLRRVNDTTRFAVVSNPEFLKEGEAVRDFFRPDRIVIGTDDGDEWARDVLVRLYRPLVRDASDIICMSTASAELTKYAANAMLATRISFMNELAHLCDATGADVTDIRKGIGSDSRIGPAFLYAGPSFGGSCLLGHETVLIEAPDGHRRLTRLDELCANEGHVELLRHGYKILTHTEAGAALVEIDRASVRRYKGPIQKIKTKTGRRLTCTADHPLVAYLLDRRAPEKAAGTERVVLAARVTENDWLPVLLGTPPTTHAVEAPTSALLTSRIPAEQVIVRLSDGINTEPLRNVVGSDRLGSIRKARVCRLDEARYASLPLEGCTFGTCSNGTYVPGEITLDADFWRILGLFAAEGWISSDGRRMRICWALNKNTEMHVAEEIAVYWHARGVKADVRVLPTSVQVSISSRILAEWLLHTIGTGKDSYDVRVPDVLWDADNACKQAFLNGAWEGDGCWSAIESASGPSGVVLEYGTTSPELADGIVRLLADQGVVANVHARMGKKSTVPAYFIGVSGADQIERAMYLIPARERRDVLDALGKQSKRIKPTGHVRVSDSLALVRVVENLAEEYEGNVYSIETRDEPHTFATTGNLVIHNCFPKDVRALLHTAEHYAVPLRIVQAAMDANDRQRDYVMSLLVEAVGNLEHATIGLWGLAFKPETDDIREAPALRLIELLVEAGATVSVYDPAALTPQNREMICEKHRAGPGIVDFAASALEAAHGTDALVLMTEWREFRQADLFAVGATMHAKVVIDARNVWDPATCRAAGFAYAGIGRR
jgi:UDPglucose 6-dehydrogenase